MPNCVALTMARRKAGGDRTAICKPYRASAFRESRLTRAHASHRDLEMFNRHLVFAFVTLIALLNPVLLKAQQKGPVIPEALVAAMKKVVPGASLVAPRDVDEAACAPIGQTPGFLHADFDGDGRKDYAALLKKETGKEKTWEGRTLREARFSFVLFMDDGRGGYKPRVIRRYLDFIPTAVVLELQPAGNVRHRETRKNVNLPNPGVTLSFCEKSATTYYIIDSKIRSVPIAD